jgi:DNA-directed RNA polymerase specialized sigma subunit
VKSQKTKPKLRKLREGGKLTLSKIKNSVGRPPKTIDKSMVKKLAQMMCTFEEIAAFFDVDKSTISRNFATLITKGREIGKISLRRSQFKLAQTNAAVCIWLGKQYLDQREPSANQGVDIPELPPDFDNMTKEEIDAICEKNKKIIIDEYEKERARKEVQNKTS